MRILEANDQTVVRHHGGYQRFVEAACIARWGRNYVDWHINGEVKAEVVQSSWRVDCPFCKDALVAQQGYPFYCPNCCMQANGGKAMDVIWPTALDRALIEEILLLRPDPDTRNWLGETVAQLAQENIQHKVPVPTGLGG